MQTQFVASWRCPSNIALVKYWGKKANQIPCNASISFTLEGAYTETTVKTIPHGGNTPTVSFFLDNEAKPSFEVKIQRYLSTIASQFEFIGQNHFEIHSHNSFPHSSGIASSASGFGALALCIMDLQYQRLNKSIDQAFYTSASILARLGSGSACRSLFGGLAMWGAHEAVANANDEYAIPVSADPIFHGFHDFILLVDKKEKKVSSTLGHGLMNGHPYAEARFKQAQLHIPLMLEALRNGNVKEMGRITELEALSLHAMMMTSTPHFMLFKPNSIAIIEKITTYREQTGLDLFYTLDAGANVHLLCTDAASNSVKQFINSELVQHCENENYLCARVGNGPERLNLLTND